jgi:hypothetical protein
MKEESMRSKQNKLLEDLDSAKQVVEECKRALSDKRRLVTVFFYFLEFISNSINKIG